jgi:hypothetical protein
LLFSLLEKIKSRGYYKHTLKGVMATWPEEVSVPKGDWESLNDIRRHKINTRLRETNQFKIRKITNQ